MKINYLLILLTFISSCTNSNKKSLKNNPTASRSSPTVEKENKVGQPGPPSEVNTSKFAFVLLDVTQEGEFERLGEGRKNVKFSYCTKIKEIFDIDEDKKYRLMDAAQESYLKSYEATFHKGRVNSRKCLVFDSYAEASKARESYMTSKK